MSRNPLPKSAAVLSLPPGNDPGGGTPLGLVVIPLDASRSFAWRLVSVDSHGSTDSGTESSSSSSLSERTLNLLSVLTGDFLGAWTKSARVIVEGRGLPFFSTTVKGALSLLHSKQPKNAGASSSSTSLVAPPWRQSLPRWPGLPHRQHGRFSLGISGFGHFCVRCSVDRN